MENSWQVNVMLFWLVLGTFSTKTLLANSGAIEGADTSVLATCKRHAIFYSSPQLWSGG